MISDGSMASLLTEFVTSFSLLLHVRFPPSSAVWGSGPLWRPLSDDISWVSDPSGQLPGGLVVVSSSIGDYVAMSHNYKLIADCS